MKWFWLAIGLTLALTIGLAGCPQQAPAAGATANLFANPKDKRTEDYITGRFG